jgi:hypothetical protein
MGVLEKTVIDPVCYPPVVSMLANVFTGLAEVRSDEAHRIILRTGIEACRLFVDVQPQLVASTLAGIARFAGEGRPGYGKVAEAFNLLGDQELRAAARCKNEDERYQREADACAMYNFAAMSLPVRPPFRTVELVPAYRLQKSLEDFEAQTTSAPLLQIAQVNLANLQLRLDNAGNARTGIATPSGRPRGLYQGEDIFAVLEEPATRLVRELRAALAPQPD